VCIVNTSDRLTQPPQVFDDKGNFVLPREVVMQNLTRIKDDQSDEKLFDLIKKREKDTKVSPRREWPRGGDRV
jgi:hypothetical protein